MIDVICEPSLVTDMFSDPVDISLSSIDYVLSQRLAAAIRGPDETVHYSDSDAEPEKVSARGPTRSVELGASTQIHPQSILKTSSNYRKREELPDNGTRTTKLTLDVEEAAVLESMRRSNLDLSSSRKTSAEQMSRQEKNLKASMGLRRHEFDDEDSSDSEFGSLIGPLMTVRFLLFP